MAKETPETQEQETPPAQPQRQALQVDDSAIIGSYANFCRVTGSPEELIIDFGLNPQPIGVPTVPIKLTQRIVTNFYTAKRLLAALQVAVQRHEMAFGVLETDVNKRVRPALQQQMQQAQAQAQAQAQKAEPKKDEAE